MLRGGRACDADGALEDWNSCVTGVPLRSGIRGLWVAKLSSDRGPIGTGPPAEPCWVGSHRCDAHGGGSAFSTYMFAGGETVPESSARSCSVMTVSSGGESGSGCRAAKAVVGENGVTSGKMDEFSLKAANDDEDMGDCAGCA